MTENDLLNILGEKICRTSQRQVAKELGFSAAFINDVIRGRRNVTAQLAEALGYERTITYTALVKRKKEVKT